MTRENDPIRARAERLALHAVLAGAGDKNVDAPDALWGATTALLALRAAGWTLTPPADEATLADWAPCRACGIAKLAHGEHVTHEYRP